MKYFQLVVNEKHSVGVITPGISRYRLVSGPRGPQYIS
jgi:hypothetical protein